MISKENLGLLMQGIGVWNQWRRNNPDIFPDLSKTDLSGGNFVSANLSRANLSGVDFIRANLSKADLSEADLRRANLSEANLSGAKLIGADLGRANLKRANLSHANLSGGDFSRADLAKVDLTRADLIRAVLSEANLSDGDLRWANLSEADLSEAKLNGVDLAKANLIRANLSDANLSDANLSGADFIRANLSGSDFTRANLSGANFIRADLIGSNLSEANLSGANLSEANLSESNLSGANLSGAKLSRATFNKVSVNSTIFADVNLSDVNGLETVVHHGPSSVGIDTLYRSRGEIPEIFLRGAGVPYPFIEYMRSRVGKAIRFYPCIISYSTEDREFAERLHSDLQAKGVNVWIAPEDIQSERKLHDRTPIADRYYDKLLLVLSEHNMKSEWVKAEICRARQDEIRNNRRKLFPIGLVDSTTIGSWESLDPDSGKDMSLEIREHLLDFSNWKDYDAYKGALDRLLLDLQAWE